MLRFGIVLRMIGRSRRRNKLSPSENFGRNWNNIQYFISQEGLSVYILYRLESLQDGRDAAEAPKTGKEEDFKTIWFWSFIDTESE